MRARRIDTTAKALTAYAKKRWGFRVHTMNETLDALLHHPNMGLMVAVVDWKSKRGKKTKSQKRLADQGWPVRFVSDTAQVDALAREVGL